MFYNNRLTSTFLMSMLLVAISVNQLNGCTDVKDCACGEQCVDVDDLKLCHSSQCVCLTGCAVGNIYIPPGVSRPRTYCNICRCQREWSDGIPVCTRVRWCNLPENRTVYQTNPACSRQQQTFFNI